MPRLGIGITTYNRAESLARTLESVARHTAAPHALFVADDGSRDATADLLRRLRVPHVSASNRGVAWNKNRVLFHLHEVARCDVAVLLEDDTAPARDGWEAPWIEAARRWGHANFAGDWFADRFVSGTGTPEDPVLSPDISGQCVSFSRAALRAVGYMDTRFGRYGYEHCDHSERMLAAGFGGRAAEPPLFYLLRSDLAVDASATGDYRDEIDRNALVYLQVKQGRRGHRWPWRTIGEMGRFLGEMRRAELYDPRMQARLALALALTPARSGGTWAAERLRAGRPRGSHAASWPEASGPRRDAR
ncbi:glycosyltransferase family 2 protein [Methylobacterium oryzisoli]|uniref:glycosyltransferase family 2 protein n=1 Tax=Methylobacterium oryzisoli TaxID=3385502 RepID=UPI0038925F77